MAFVQAVQGALAGGQVTSQSATGSAIGSGNTVVGAIALDYVNGATAVSSITDNASGNTYTVLDTLNDGSKIELVTFIGTNITGGPTTITVNFTNSGPSFPQVVWNEYSSVGGNDGHTIQYQTSVGTGTDAVTSGSVTTTVNGDTVVGFTINSFFPGGGTGGATVSAGTGYTRRSTDATAGDWDATTEDLTQASAGAVAGTFTVGTASGDWLTAVIALKPAGTFSVSLTESASAADTLTEIMTASWTLTESGSAADSLSIKAIASLLEAGSAADSPSVKAIASLLETGSAADSPSGLMTASWTIAESGSAADNLSVPYLASLLEAGNAIDLLTFTLLAPPAPAAPYGIYQPKDLQHAIQWWFQAQQALQQALQNGDPSQVPQLMRQIRRWVGMINALRLAQAYGVKSEATRQKLMYCAPIWPNQGEN